VVGSQLSKICIHDYLRGKRGLGHRDSKIAGYETSTGQRGDLAKEEGREVRNSCRGMVMTMIPIHVNSTKILVIRHR